MATTYNTGNAIGSADPRDAYDNASNFDEFSNSASQVFTDRRGVSRKTITGAIAGYAAFNVTGVWTTATAYNVNDVWRDGAAGAFYLVLADYTSGASATADIAGGNVVVHQPKDWVVSVATIADLRALEPAFDGQQCELLGHTVAGIGGGMFYADFSSSAADDNGVTVVTVEGKRWVRRFDGRITPQIFGAIGKGVTDDTAAIQQAIAYMPATGGEIYFPSGLYLFSSTINISKSIIFKGAGSATVNNNNIGSVFLKAASLNGDGIRLASLGAKLVDITVQGVPGNGGDGVVLVDSRCVLEDVGVFGMGRDGVRIGIDASPSNSNLWAIRNLKSKANGRDGLRISSLVRPSLPDANAGVLTMADLQGNGECGLYLGNNALNTFVGLCCQANGTYGVFSSPDSYDNTFYGGDFEINGRVGGASMTSYADFYIEAGSTANRVIGITCFNFPVSFVCNEPDNFILSANDGIFANDNKYAGLHLRNKASSVPTVLDWYEEGVFTPAVEGATTAGVGTYSVQQGFYTRIGNVVKFHLNVAWSEHTGTGNMRITGLPFTSVLAGFQPVDIVPSGFTTPADSVVRAMVTTNDDYITLYSVLTSGTTTLAPLAMDTAASCWISGSYTVPG